MLGRFGSDNTPLKGTLGPSALGSTGAGAFTQAGRGIAATPYAKTNGDSNVAVQWLFDESSGDIVDEVAGVTLADQGTMTYSVSSGTGLFANLGPGITTASGGNMFLKASDTNELDIGTGDFTIEWWFKTTQSTGTPMLWEHDDEGAIRGYYAQMDATTGVITTAWTGGGAGVNRSYTFTAGWNDGGLHKLRLVGDRTAETLTAYFDGVSLGSGDISAISGKSIQAGQASFGAYPFPTYTAAPFNGTYYTWRLALNKTANLGGPNGG